MVRLGYRRIVLTIFDDDDEDVILYKKALSDLGFDPELLHFGTKPKIIEYINELKKQNPRYPNIIFLDLDMPKISGFEILELLKQDQNLRMIPIIVMSHSDIPDTIETCYKKHANSYIVKPPSYDELKLTLQAIFVYWFDIVNQYLYGYNVFD